MQINVNITPLTGEFWPLEGVIFNADDEYRILTVLCSVYGDEKFRKYVELRFLSGLDTEIIKVINSPSLNSFSLTGNISTINKMFLGFGLAFKKDFETGGKLSVVVEGSCTYSFVIDLVRL